MRETQLDVPDFFRDWVVNLTAYDRSLLAQWLDEQERPLSLSIAVIRRQGPVDPDPNQTILPGVA